MIGGAADVPVTVVHAELDVPDVPAFVADVQRLSARLGVPVQAVRADRLTGPLHVLMAARHAARAARADRSRADDPAVAWLLFAAAARQIQRAVADLGVPAGPTSVAFVVLGDVVAEVASGALQATYPQAHVRGTWSSSDGVGSSAWPQVSEALAWWRARLGGDDERTVRDRVCAAMAVRQVERA